MQFISVKQNIHELYVISINVDFLEGFFGNVDLQLQVIDNIYYMFQLKSKVGEGENADIYSYYFYV